MKKVLIGLLLVLVLLVAIGFVLPTEFQIEESIVIDAPSAAVHEHVGELRNWPVWAPWEKQDDSIVTTYGPTTSGVGASQTWTSDQGDGELTLTASDPDTGIAYDMAFIAGESRSPATCAMTYTAEGDGTKVTWTMEGDVGSMMPPVMAGYMNLFMPGMVGSMFQMGLTDLKATVEGTGDAQG